METNALMKEMYLGPDARSSRGIMARGQNVYNGGSFSSKGGSLQSIAKKRLKSMQQRQMK